MSWFIPAQRPRENATHFSFNFLTAVVVCSQTWPTSCMFHRMLPCRVCFLWGFGAPVIDSDGGCRRLAGVECGGRMDVGRWVWVLVTRGPRHSDDIAFLLKPDSLDRLWCWWVMKSKWWKWKGWWGNWREKRESQSREKKVIYFYGAFERKGNVISKWHQQIRKRKCWCGSKVTKQKKRAKSLHNEEKSQECIFFHTILANHLVLETELKYSLLSI